MAAARSRRHRHQPGGLGGHPPARRCRAAGCDAVRQQLPLVAGQRAGFLARHGRRRARSADREEPRRAGDPGAGDRTYRARCADDRACPDHAALRDDGRTRVPIHRRGVARRQCGSRGDSRPLQGVRRPQHQPGWHGARALRCRRTRTLSLLRGRPGGAGRPGRDRGEPGAMVLSAAATALAVLGVATPTTGSAARATCCCAIARPWQATPPRARSGNAVEQRMLRLPNTFHESFCSHGEGPYQPSMGFQAVTRLSAISCMIKQHEKYDLDESRTHARCLPARGHVHLAGWGGPQPAITRFSGASVGQGAVAPGTGCVARSGTSRRPRRCRRPGAGTCGWATSRAPGW